MVKIPKIIKIKSLLRLWKHLNTREKIWFGIFVVVILFSITFLVSNFYQSQTRPISVLGGTYVEALSESPHYLNPILATNDADRDMSRLIFSSLLKYNENGDLTPDLAVSYAVSKDGKTYTIKLKKGVIWHDGQPVNADDVIFTINAVQGVEYGSPLRASWQGIQAESPDENTIILKLKTPYVAFVENLALLGILPKHIWSKILPQNFPLADFNLKPIGSGPYKFVKLQKDALGKIISVNLTANEDYFVLPPLIEDLVFKFYTSEEEAVSAFNRKEVDGVLLQTAQNKNQLRGLSSSNVFSIPSLRIYGIFFNTDQAIFKDQIVRIAINYAINREELLDKILNGEGKIPAGPIPPGLPGSSPDIQGYSYNPVKTTEILEKDGWKKDETGVYAKKLGKDKNPTRLTFTIITTKSIQLAATMIRDYLNTVGMDIDLKIVSLGELQQNIRNKDYNAILIGESYTAATDPYVFWHGAAIKDPGLNLSLYNNRKVNKILEDTRQISDPIKRAQKLMDFQKLVINDAPAVFLYSPNYIYAIRTSVKNIDFEKLITPSSRFSKINEWSVATDRIWK